MFLKHNSRPALAFASASAGSMDKQSWSEKKSDSFAFSSSQSNDFNSFSSGSANDQNKAPKKPKRKKVTLEVPGRRIAIIAAVIVGVILLIALVSGMLLSKSDDIMYEDNAFAAYQESDDAYRVVMNGKVLKDVFAGEVKLTEAKDKSFAYVEAVVEDAINVYILDDNKLTLVCEGVNRVLALADYAPGVVYEYRNKVEYYYDGAQTSLSRKDDALPQNFVIAPDGTAVAYTIANKENSSINGLYVCTVDRAVPEAISTGNVSMLPVSISNNGVYIVACAENTQNRNLYLISNDNKYKIGGVDGAFEKLIACNTDGTEIVFSTTNGTDSRSYIYNCAEIKKDTTSAHHISNGIAMPQITNPEICAPESFKKCYFQDIKARLTIYVNKKYESVKVSDYIGQIDPQERFLYVINEQKDMLVQIELLGERFKKDDNRSTNIATDVENFILTNKGNIYYTDSHGDLYFYKLTKGKPSRITNSVDGLTFYNYANQVMFEKVEDGDISGIYMSEEGSDYEALTFDKVTPTSLPNLTNVYSKKSYAYYYDEAAGSYVLFYTSNGKSFKKIADCDDISFVNDGPIIDIPSEETPAEGEQ